MQAIAQGLGVLVFWDPKSETVTIEMINKPVAYSYTHKKSVQGFPGYFVDRETHTKNSRIVQAQMTDALPNGMTKEQAKRSFTLERPVLVSSPGNPKLCSIDMIQEFKFFGDLLPSDSWYNHILIDPARKALLINQIGGCPFVMVYQKPDGTGDYWVGPSEVYTQQKGNNYCDKKVYFIIGNNDYRVLTDLTGFDLIHVNYDYKAIIQKFAGKTLYSIIKHI